MKAEGLLFLGCGSSSPTDIVYWHISHDPTGNTALALSVGLAVLTRSDPASYPGGQRRCQP